MNLSAPRQIVFLISLIVVLLAIVSLYVAIPVVSAYAFWVAIAGYAVLAAGCLMKGV